MSWLEIVGILSLIFFSIIGVGIFTLLIGEWYIDRKHSRDYIIKAIQEKSTRDHRQRPAG